MLNYESKSEGYVMTAIMAAGVIVASYTIFNWDELVASKQREEVKVLAQEAELKQTQKLLLKELSDSGDIGLKEFAKKWSQDNPEPTKQTINDLKKFSQNTLDYFQKSGAMKPSNNKDSVDDTQ